MLLLINFFGHYLFASVTAHVTAMIPVLLAVASTIPGVNMHTLALGLCLQLGIMGILTPYASGPSPVYYGSGYLPAADYWRLGAIFGVIFFVAFLVIGVPWMLAHTVIDGGSTILLQAEEREDYGIEPISNGARLPRRPRGPGGRLLRHPDAPGQGKLSHHGHADIAGTLFRQGVRLCEESRRDGEPGPRRARRQDRRRDHPRVRSA